MSLLFALLISTPLTFSVDTLWNDTIYNLPSVEVVAPIKQQGNFFEQPIATSSFSLNRLESERIQEPKDLSLITPNLYLPDYGSKMTSSIYVRGIGARMDQPSMGLYVDNVPILNKNSYDFDFYDIRRVDVLRGPQGTLYGRNTIGGVINMYTLSPFIYEGTRVAVGYGNGNTVNARLATYQRPTEKIGYSLALNHYSSDGFFTNEYNDEKCDKIISDAFRFRVQAQLNERMEIDNIFSFNRVKQDGFAYSLYDEETHTRYAINHNDPCFYDRLGVMNGTGIHFTNSFLRFSSITSYQYMDDSMTLDQDFLPTSMFTLTQAQREHAITQELVVRSNKPETKWQWLLGAFGFYKHISMDAPVTFKRDGIDELILGNANKGIHSAFPDADLLIEEDEFLIASHFKLPTYGLALYHQSTVDVGKWRFTAGIRADYEYAKMKYDNNADLHYRFTKTMPEYKFLTTTMKGNENTSFFEILPRFSVMYQWNKANVYATVSRGYKAGGFNTQIFSDILQNNVMNNMMDDLGVHFMDDTTDYDVSAATSYKPEYSWNYEIGTHLKLWEDRLSLDIALFYIDCKDQQITVFPPGKSTGRLMSNAGHTRSFGTELSLNYYYKNLHLNGSYGYTNAKFLKYDDGNVDYSDNYVPYAPQNTLYVSGAYDFRINKNWIDYLWVKIDWSGVGKIYWNETNTISQSFYHLLGASIGMKKNHFMVSVWGKNLTDTSYNTFYFKSIGNSFVQRGKPLQIGVSLNINI